MFLGGYRSGSDKLPVATNRSIATETHGARQKRISKLTFWPAASPRSLGYCVEQS